MRVFGTKRPLLLVLATLVGILFFFSASGVAASISQGYKTNDESLKTGMAAALSGDSSEGERLVEPVTQTNSDKFVGVITTVDDNLVNLSDNTTEVLVSTEGKVSVFVSDIGGNIGQGDYLSVSPLKGVLMKSRPGNKTVAVALQNFDNAQKEEKTISTNDGSQTVNIGLISAELNENVASAQDENKQFLVVAGESLTGKAVNQFQVIAALVIFAIILIVEGSIIYGAIHSSVSALGRNPLAKKAVFKQLLQVSWLALVIIVVGFGAIYLILWF